MLRDELFEPLYGKGQMGAALISHNGVDLINNQCAGGLQHTPPALAGQQDVKRLRCSYDYVWWPLNHCGSLRGRGVASAHKRADVDLRKSQRLQLLLNPLKWQLQIGADVVTKSFQRRHINDVGRVIELPIQAKANQIVDCREECSKSLTRTGRRGNERVLLRFNSRPGQRLWQCSGSKGFLEPARHGWMKYFEAHGNRHYSGVRGNCTGES